jgi:hypothetical protein
MPCAKLAWAFAGNWAELQQKQQKKEALCKKDCREI